MSEPILVWGAGAIGGTFGAALVRAGRDVTFVDVVPEHVEAIRDPERGLRITGPVDPMVVKAPAYLPKELEGNLEENLSSGQSPAHRGSLPSIAAASCRGRVCGVVAEWPLRE